MVKSVFQINQKNESLIV